VALLWHREVREHLNIGAPVDGALK
jgi:hypothetical protein